MKPLLESCPRIEIKRTLGVCGGASCVGDRRVTVHSLVIWRRRGLTDEESLRAIQGLTNEELQAAWKYYEAHSEEINALIDEEEAD